MALSKKPLISIIIPCYNQEKYLHYTLESVYRQSFQDWECIMVNDGSIDNTEKIIHQWLNKDKRFKYLKKSNGGLSSARNIGIINATGEWIQFLDADDLIAENKLSTVLENQSYDLIVTNFRLFLHSSGQRVSSSNLLGQFRLNFESILYKWDEEFTIPIHCAIFRREIIPLFNETLKAKEDWLFWIQTFLKNPKPIFIDKDLATYRVHDNNMTKDKKLLNDYTIEAVNLIRNLLPESQSNIFTSVVIKRLYNKLLEYQTLNTNLLNSKSYKIGNTLVNVLLKIRKPFT